MPGEHFHSSVTRTGLGPYLARRAWPTWTETLVPIRPLPAALKFGVFRGLPHSNPLTCFMFPVTSCNNSTPHCIPLTLSHPQGTQVSTMGTDYFALRLRQHCLSTHLIPNLFLFPSQQLASKCTHIPLMTACPRPVTRVSQSAHQGLTPLPAQHSGQSRYLFPSLNQHFF
jgi:hypothetical protein